MFFPQWHIGAATYFTEREKSPGALSLSLMRKAPSCLCLFSISSALALGILPKNHLEEEENKNKSVSASVFGNLMFLLKFLLVTIQFTNNSQSKGFLILKPILK